MPCLTDSIVAAFTTGQATAAEIETVETHLAGCTDCRTLVAQLAGLAPPPRSSVTLLERSDEEDAPRARPTLAPGTILAERYRIVRFLAQGGMGEVYAAEDNELRETLALKIPAGGLVPDAELLARLKREVLLARRIAHPNVCRIFDVGFHRDGARSIVFLTMELLDGETLAERLRRRGALPPDEALPLAEQMVAGLTAAHANGVIHRDLKSSNVVLVPTDGPTERAVIIDFGLARGETRVDAFSLGGASHAVVGTPDYLAPEQLAGAPASVVTDVYALGVVLFEMVTGRLPFVGATAREAAARRLHETAPRVRTLVPSLSTAWDETIAGCLARDPGERLGDARAVGAALSQRRRRRPLRLGWRIVAGLLSVLALAGAATVLWRQRTRAAAAWPRPSLAVVDAALWDDDAPWPTTAVSEALRAALADDGDVRVVEDEAVVDAARERRGEDATALPALARRLRVGRAALVSASADAGGRVHAEVALWPADPTATPRALSADGRLDEVTTRLRDELRATLQLGTRARGAIDAGSPRRLQLAAEAARLARRGDDAGAVARWRRALADGPPSARLSSALADALDRLGYAASAGQERARALAAAADRPRLERRLAADAARAQGRWAEVAAVARATWAEHDDDTTAALALIEAERALGDHGAAFATLARLRAATARDDVALDLAEARTALAAGDAERARVACIAAEGKARREGETARLSDARRLESAALLSRGQPGPARIAVADALALALQTNDPLRAVDALVARALVETQSNQLDAARATLLEALARARPLGRADRVARLLLDLAALARHQGRDDEATRWLDQWNALTTARTRTAAAP